MLINALRRSVLLLFVFIFSTVFASVISRQPYLQEMTSHSVVIAWRTADPVIGEVVYAPNPPGEEGQGGSFQKAAVKESTETRHHVVTLKGLHSGASYLYMIQENGKPVSNWNPFTTFPESDSAPFSFGVLGDSGTASSDQKEIAKRLFSVHPDLAIHTGDVIYGKKTAADFDQKFFKIYQSLLSQIPFFLSMGNHDVDVMNGEPYLENYYLPQNSPGKGRYYSFDCGEAHFVALDSNESLDHWSPQYEWLKKDLETTTKPLKIAFFHHPLYSSGYHGSSMKLRKDLQPLFDKERLTLVFNGHDHDYERSKPIHGVTYVVTGGGGAPLYPAFGESWTADSETAFNFVYCRVNGRKIHLEARDENGKILDRADLSVNDR